VSPAIQSARLMLEVTAVGSTGTRFGEPDAI
jgi:hypothetical protein